MARTTKAQRRKAKFQEEVYRILRGYQEAQAKPVDFKSGVRVGHLDVELTRVFDRVSAAYEQSAAPPERGEG